MPWASALALQRGEQTYPKSCMQFGQIGLEQIRHRSWAISVGCRGQGTPASGSPPGTAGGTGGWASTLSVTEEAIGRTATGVPSGVVDCPNCSLTSLSTNSEESRPQAGQTKRTGRSLIAGVRSNSCFAPHVHCIFTLIGIE